MDVLVLAYTSCICLCTSVGPAHDNVCLVQESTSERPYSCEVIERAGESRDYSGSSVCPSDPKDGIRTDLAESYNIYKWITVVGNSLISAASNMFNNVFESVKDTGGKIYNKIKNNTLEFIEGVRQVLKEELRSYYLVDSAVSTFLNDFAAGSPLATATTYLWNIVLVLLCLVLSYILMYFVSWLFVLAFNCIIILLHYWFESWDILKYLYRQLISIFKWIYFFVFEHPYLLCVIVVLLFVCWLLKVMYSWCVRPYLVYRERHEERNRRRVMADSIIHLGEQLDEISERLSRIERHLGVQGHQ